MRTRRILLTAEEQGLILRVVHDQINQCFQACNRIKSDSAVSERQKKDAIMHWEYKAKELDALLKSFYPQCVPPKKEA